jgi:hypothetical protein
MRRAHPDFSGDVVVSDLFGVVSVYEAEGTVNDLGLNFFAVKPGPDDFIHQFLGGVLKGFGGGDLVKSPCCFELDSVK